ncbi:MAG: DUF748 domain-containing protein [Nitrospiraceae bacterium]|nr:DUF748 domain-containing protein [Nitrospiraceae bacterium]
MLKRFLSPAFLKKAAFWLGGIVAFIAVTGFLVVPAVLRPLLERKLAEALSRPVTVKSVYFNPFALSAALRGVTVGQKDGPGVLVSFDEFYVNLQAMSVVKRGLIVSSVRLVKPYVNVARNKDLSYNFSDLLTAPPAPSKKEEKAAEPFRFSINNIQVIDGSADFLDGPKDTRHTVRSVNLSVPFLSNLPYDLASYVEPYFTATVNGTKVEFKGRTLPFEESLETTLDIDIRDIGLAHYLAYSPMPLRFKVLSGALDVQTTLLFRQFKDRKPQVSLKGTVAVKDIKLVDTRRRALVEFKRFSVSLLPSDLMAKEVHLSDVSLQSPKLTVDRDREGKLGIVEAFVVGQAKGGEQAPAAPAEKQTGETTALPIVDIDALTLSDGTVLFTDWTPVPPAATGEGEAEPVRIRIEKIGLKGAGLSTRKDRKGTLALSLNINRKGFLKTQGTLGIDPLAFETDVKIGELGLSALQPYIGQKTEISLNDGRFFLQGNVRVLAGKGKAPFVFYRGGMSLRDLDVLDNRNDEDILSWKQLAVDGIDVKSEPFSVRIKTIALSEPHVRFAVEDDGVPALNKALRTAPASTAPVKEEPQEDANKETPPADAGPAPDIAIGLVTLAKGRIDLIDDHVQPRYTSSITDIEAKVAGLTSKKDIMADLLLKASIDGTAPFQLAGKVHPFKENLFVDLKADLKDLELSPFTPYSGTYVGRAVEKGKLFLGFEYHIVGKKLDAKNNIFIDQLTLGGSVDSPKATKLPVGLAVALLKDRNGEIRFDIPVSGEIDNPEFSVLRIVLKVLGNLLVKAATSPFALLGSLMGGGEELGYVEFDYGTSEVTEQNQKKLETLANALYQRPSLKLEITGFTDKEKDTEALRTNRMQALIVAEKMKDLARRDNKPVQPESVKITDEEYPVYLKKAYRNGKFSKPRNFLGIPKDVPDAEMEKLLLDSVQVTDGDLRELAGQRARTVKELIVRSGKVEPERIYLLEPKSPSPEQKENVKNSRVDFSLK